MTACSFLVSDGTPDSKAFQFCVYHYATFMSFNEYVFHASNRACCEGKARCAALRGLTQVSIAAEARGQQPPEPMDPQSSLSLLRNPGVGEVKGHLFSEHLPNQLNAFSSVYCVATDSGFIKINLVLLRRILINYLVMKNVRGTTLLHQGLMITLMDAVARFS